MKQLLTILFFLALLSCNSVKKTTGTTQTRKDSTGTNTALIIDVKKTDSTGAGSQTATEIKAVDKAYTKVTVKEVFDDAFDFEGRDSLHVKTTPIKASDYSAEPRLKYRETITETGTETDRTTTSKASNVQSSVKKTDSTGAAMQQQTTVSADTQTTETKKAKITLLPGWLFGALLLAIILFVCYKISE